MNYKLLRRSSEFLPNISIFLNNHRITKKAYFCMFRHVFIILFLIFKTTITGIAKTVKNRFLSFLQTKIKKCQAFGEKSLINNKNIAILLAIHTLIFHITHVSGRTPEDVTNEEIILSLLFSFILSKHIRKSQAQQKLLSLSRTDINSEQLAKW